MLDKFNQHDYIIFSVQFLKLILFLGYFICGHECIISSLFTSAC